MNNETTMQSSAEAYLQALSERGIEYVFANAGTDFAPVIEAMVAATGKGRTIPRFFTVPHENVAVAMAHGYYLACGKPAAVMVHVTVGTANALCGIMNAARDNVPVLLAAGRTPSTETGHAGSRNGGIHWGQESFDQGGILREYVKWDYELRAGQPVDVIVGRALDIAMSEPRGPVYLCLPREVLGDPPPAAPLPPRRTLPGATQPRPDPAAVRRAADWIAAAEFPLLVTASSGRYPENVALLGQLTDRYGIAVTQPGPPGARDLNLPWDHPMFLGSHNMEALQRADVVIVLDCDVPWWPRLAAPGPEARIIHIGPDPFFSSYPYRGFETDLAITSSTTAALEQLQECLAQSCSGRDAAIRERRDGIRDWHRQLTDTTHARMQAASGARPILHEWVASCINQVKDQDAIIINEMGFSPNFLELTRPRTYQSSSTAGGLGFGLGAALGAKLAAPDRQVILVIGDGSYMFGNPTPAHFIARSEDLPTLTIVLNNNKWNAVHHSTQAMYPDGLAVQLEQMPLVDLKPSPDYEKIMEACGGYGERVEDPALLAAAMRRGLEANSRGQAALLNVIMQG